MIFSKCTRGCKKVMKNNIIRKIRSRRGGINWLIALLIIANIALVVLILIPVWNNFQYEAGKVACDQAMKSAGDGLIIEYLGSLEEITSEEAMKLLDKIMPARDELCPLRGSIYLKKGDNGIFTPVCGIHDSDEKERVRLNASYAKVLVEEKLEKAKEAAKLGTETEEKKTDDAGREVTTIVINGKELGCVRVLQEEHLRHGTAYTQGYDEVVAFYGIEGEGNFNDGRVKNGKIAYFVYADKNYCALWRAKDGWSGDAYK